MEELSPEEIRISKMMAKALRHHPEAFGIHLDKHGWADVSALIAGIRARDTVVDAAILDKIVAYNNKRRFAYNDDHTKIRACQGHTVPVDVELKKAIPPVTLYHGTIEQNCASIKKKGLLPMKRLYVHLSDSIETAQSVATRRKGKSVIYAIDTDAMLRDGIDFYLSQNGVWQVKNVPPAYLKRIE